MLSHAELTKLILSKDMPSPQADDLIIRTRHGVEAEGSIGSANSRSGAYKFGSTSLTRMNGVLPALVNIAHKALAISWQDFGIGPDGGLRTIEDQRRIVKAGASQTMFSKHLRQADGYGHALDLVPTESDGTFKWEWDKIYPVVLAVDEVATGMGIANRIRWGGAWDRTLADFGGSKEAYAAEVQAYVIRHPGKDFIDGPHIEWIS